MLKLLVTGGCGFIGSNLVDKLRRLGFDVDIIDLKLGSDIRDLEVFVSKKYDYIFHLAAQASIPKSFANPLWAYDHNVLGTLKVLEYAKKTGAGVIFSSSASVYEPMSPYAVSKLVCEKYLKFYEPSVRSVALRYFNVFGKRQEIANGGEGLALSTFLKQRKENKPFTIVGTGKQRRDFVYVGDVVRANIAAMEYLESGGGFDVFDIGFGKNYSINEVVEMVKKKHPYIYLPPRIEPFENLADIIKAKILLDWSPKVSLKKWLASS